MEKIHGSAQLPYYYSVPYEYVRKRVDVRLTSHIVEIYSEGRRIASHKRLIGRRGQYSTLEEHMPKKHQLYSQWDGNRFRLWSAKCGNSVHTVVERLLASYRVEEQAYKSCLSLLKLSDKYGSQRLETVCELALQQVPSPRYKLIQNILVTQQDIKIEKPASRSQNAFVRGAAYYGGEHHGE